MYRRSDCLPSPFVELTLGLFVATLVSFLFLSSSRSSAAEISASTSVNATVSVLEACTMDGDYSTYVPHTAVIPAGTNKSDIGLSTFRVICNDAEGFSVYAVGYANYEIGNTKLLASVNGTLNPTYDIETGLSMDANTSSWAMKLTAVSGTYAPTIQSDTNGSFVSYHVVPSTSTKVATFNGITDAGNNATGSAFSATYRANIKSTQPAGTYSGIVKYTMVHPATATPNEPKNCGTANRICYWPNANGIYEGTMGQQTANANTETTLIASNFSKQGYGFAGWSDAYDWVINEGSSSNPDAHIYGPNETITTPSSMTNGLSLYAVWVKSAGTMQANANDVCNGLYSATYDDKGDSDESTWSIDVGPNTVSALTDERDGNTYAIAKLGDRGCWMIENLRLDDTATLTLSNTNNPLNDGTNVTLKHNYADTDTHTNLSATSSVAYNADTAPSGWCTTNSAACDDQSRLRTDNTANRVSYSTTQSMYTDDSLYSYGNYYNWYSATAGNGTYGMTSGNTAGDLCPRGWHLPTGAGSGEFGLLSNSLGGLKNASDVAQYMSSSTTPTGTIMNERLRHYPNNFVYSGDVYGASLNTRGSSGDYWLSTASSNSNAYSLYFVSSSVSPGTGGYTKYYGRAVRCHLDGGVQ